MDWRVSIGLRPLYKSVSDVDSVHKICSLRKKTCSLRSCLGPSRCLRCEHGAHCWTYVYWMYCTVAIGAHWLIFFFFSLEWEPAKAVLCKIAMKFVVYECLGSKNNVNRGEKLTIFNANGYCFWLSVPFGLPKHFLAVQKSPCSVELIEITWYAQYLKKKKKWIVKAYLRRMCVYCVVFKTEWTKALIAVCS